MGEARRRKLRGEQTAPLVEGGSRSSTLPVSHYEFTRRHNTAMFDVMKEDIDRLAKTGKQVEDILPPNGECAEVRYCKGHMQRMQYSPKMSKFFASQEAIMSLAHTVIREYRAVLAYEHAGRKTYYFSEGLTEGLCCTVLNAPCSDFRLPVPCVQLVYSNEYASEAIGYLDKGAATSGAKRNSVISVYVREDNLKEVGCRRLIITAYEQDGDVTLRGVSRQLALKDGWSLEEALRTDWDAPDLKKVMSGGVRPLRLVNDLEDQVELKEGDVQAFLEEGLMFTRLVVNSVLYITSRSADLAQRVWPRPIGPQLHGSRSGGSSPGPKQWTMVGEGVEAIPIVIDPRATHEPGDPARQRLRYKVRFLVPGFYRRKPGSDPSAPKDVWVRHHYRGPQMADLISNPYIVK